MKDLIQRLRHTASKGISVWGDLQNEAADALERLTARSVKTPEQYYHVVQMCDGSINHIPYVKPEDAIDYGNRRAAAATAPLLDKIDQLQADAARYRWLKVNPEWLGWEHDFRPDEVEREIDAAMKEQPL